MGPAAQVLSLQNHPTWRAESGWDEGGIVPIGILDSLAPIDQAGGARLWLSGASAGSQDSMLPTPTRSSMPNPSHITSPHHPGPCWKSPRGPSRTPGTQGAAHAGWERCAFIARAGYLRGMKRDECVAPMPGRPCFTGL